MKPTLLIDRLHDLAESHAPGPDPAFVARLGVELRHMDQVPVMSERQPQSHRTHWLRFFRSPFRRGAIALAGAFVALRPEPSRPHQVHTAGPGVTAPETNQVEPGQRVLPPTAVVTTPAVPTTVRSNAVLPATTPTTQATRHLVVPGPDGGPATTVAPTPQREPTTTTTTAPPAPTAEALNLHCTAGSPGGTATVSCTWSPSTASAFYAYRLTREKPGTNRVVVFTSNSRTATGYADHDVAAGAGYSYWIDAIDTAGNVVGHGTTTVTCC